MAEFGKALAELGYAEGQNIAIEYRWAMDRYDRLPALAVELIGMKVAVIASTSTPAAVAARAATTKVPIVFATASDPMHLGLVTSLSRPGGNGTGATQLSVEVGPRRLELVRELIPDAARVGFLVNPTNVVAEDMSRDQQAVAHRLGVVLLVLQASNEREIDNAFSKLAAVRASALIVNSGPFFNTRNRQLATPTIRHSMPTVHACREFVLSGGLLSYGGSLLESYHTAGLYTGRILKGEKPGDLPVQQSTRVELIINLRTARALDLAVPSSVFARADEIIE